MMNSFFLRFAPTSARSARPVGRSIGRRAGRLFLPGCAVAAGLLTVSNVAFAAPETAPTTTQKAASAGAVVTLSLGKTATFPLPAGAKYTVEVGNALIVVAQNGGALSIKANREGEARLRIQAPNLKDRVLQLRIVDRTGQILPRVEQKSLGQLVERAVVPGVAPQIDPSAPYYAPTEPSIPAPTQTEQATPPPTGAPPLPPLESTPSAQPLASPTQPRNATPIAAPAPTNSATQISPNLPAPANKTASVNYRTVNQMPRNMQGSGGRQVIPVTQGLARLLSFKDNILAVFFSDQNVMDARAINARTIAVTGVAPGFSTLAVFSSRYPGDAVGKASIYRIQTTPQSGGTTTPADPATVERAIVTALNDPRVRVSVFALPDGSNAVKLSGVVRDTAEVQGATTTASFYAPRVISSLYADVNAPTLEAVLSPSMPGMSPEENMQDTLRRLTDNDSIELVPLPTGMALKASVGSIEEAQALFRLLPSFNQPITPFIVIRGTPEGQNPYFKTNIPILQGEDRQITQKLQSATGIDTVYAVRASANGLAIYGTVRDRAEFDTVRRYALVMPQEAAPAPIQGTSQGGFNEQPRGTESRAIANSASSTFRYPTGVQMFVKILDPTQAVLRRVNVETNVVEISRNALKNLGIEYGSAQILTENVTPTIPGIPGQITNQTFDPVSGALTGQTVTPPTVGTPGRIERTFNPAFQAGTVLGGNGLIGTGGFGLIDALRTRFNALYTNGNARILSRPNVSAIEGSVAQITIGGTRPVPSTAVAGGGSGAVGQSFEFRRFGVIMTMRPTLTDDDTIILQLRADITSLNPLIGVNFNGSTVPGENVRSVDSVLTVRSGDIVVMGGLITNERNVQTTKFPILGDLPLIGSLFKSKRFENNESELAIFMMPRIERMPASPNTIWDTLNVPGLPPLPGLQETNNILVSPIGIGG